MVTNGLFYYFNLIYGVRIRCRTTISDAYNVSLKKIPNYTKFLNMDISLLNIKLDKIFQLIPIEYKIQIFYKDTQKTVGTVAFILFLHQIGARIILKALVTTEKDN
jgi:hypothetical protein